MYSMEKHWYLGAFNLSFYGSESQWINLKTKKITLTKNDYEKAMKYMLNDQKKQYNSLLDKIIQIKDEEFKKKKYPSKKDIEIYTSEIATIKQKYKTVDDIDLPNWKFFLEKNKGPADLVWRSFISIFEVMLADKEIGEIQFVEEIRNKYITEIINIREEESKLNEEITKLLNPKKSWFGRGKTRKRTRRNRLR